MNNQAGIRLAVIDTDSAFLTVLGKRLEGAGWEHRVLAGSVPVEDLVAMKLNALLVDLSVLGPQGWEFLEKVCGAIPGLGVTRPWLIRLRIVSEIVGWSWNSPRSGAGSP